MFTGLVEEVGTLRESVTKNQGRVLRVAASRVLEDLVLGDSVSVNGVCQTVTAIGSGDFSFEAVGDTLTKTTLDFWAPGRRSIWNGRAGPTRGWGATSCWATSTASGA